jgi:hypothetical protein
MTNCPQAGKWIDIENAQYYGGVKNAIDLLMTCYEQQNN